MTGAAPVLAGRAVTLRPYSAGFSAAELASLYRWSRDPEIIALAGGAPLEMGFEEFRRLFTEQAAGKNGGHEQLFAILDEHGDLIGRTGLFVIDDRARRAELGIVIGEPDRWGRGYGRDAVSTLVGFAFRSLGLRQIELYTYPGNLRARQAFAAVGFREMGRRRRFCFHRGFCTEIRMTIEASQHGLPEP